MASSRTAPRRHVTRVKNRAWLRYAAFSVAAALGVAAAYPLSIYQVVSEAVDDIVKKDVTPLLPQNERPVELAPADGSSGSAINILLMGSDVRTGYNRTIGGNVAGGMRNDTTIIMHISADRERVELISIPRDSKVQIPDCTLFDGTLKRGWFGNFNVAFANGGVNGDPAEAAACTIRAVESLTGIYIHHYAVVDFYGFQKMIDEIGGVPMCIPTRLVSKKAKLNLKAGPQILNGKNALAYARMRTAEVSGGTVDGTDPDRIGRQQDLLAKVAETVLEKGILFKPDELGDFLGAGAEYMTMSPELADLNYLIGLAFSLRHLDKDNIVFKTVPWSYRGNKEPSPGGLDWTSEAFAMFDRIAKDKPIKGKTVADTSQLTDPEPEPSPTVSGAPGPEPEPEATEPTQEELDLYDLVGECNVGKKR